MSDAPAPDAPHFTLSINLPAESGLTETAARNRQLVVDAYRSIVTGDANALTRLLSPDVVFHEAPSLPYGCTVHGIEAALNGVAAMFEAWSKVEVEVTEFAAAGDLVILYMSMTAVSRATGRIYRGPTAEMFRFNDGLIVEWRPIYWDTHAVRIACGTN